ncbi:hypothetical protein [Aestuariivita boseongensis]|uniref:hypothetical protein n=1 Tax=Aestuariivita boseongensis TaxID=1470562 RepID=UPI0012F7929F|nr:hypothetical protein [Aestuariivita boseongensis]
MKEVTDLQKAALILGLSIIMSAAILTFFSPYHSCMRALAPSASDKNIPMAHLQCNGGWN